jgi:hypothetical protein
MQYFVLWRRNLRLIMHTNLHYRRMHWLRNKHHQLPIKLLQRESALHISCKSFLYYPLLNWFVHKLHRVHSNLRSRLRKRRILFCGNLCWLPNEPWKLRFEPRQWMRGELND